MKLISLKIVKILFYSIFILSIGCANNHRVFINPSIPIHTSNIGNSLPVAVKVIDARSSNIISKWQGGLKLRKFTISSQPDLKDVFTTRVKQGLTKLGFSPKNPNADIRRHLKVEIINLISRYRGGLESLDIHVKAGVKASCTNKEIEFHKKFIAKKKRSGITPASFPNENLLNACLSEIMGKLFTHPSIIACLSQ